VRPLLPPTPLSLSLRKCPLHPRPHLCAGDSQFCAGCEWRGGAGDRKQRGWGFAFRKSDQGRKKDSGIKHLSSETPRFEAGAENSKYLCEEGPVYLLGWSWLLLHRSSRFLETSLCKLQRVILQKGRPSSQRQLGILWGGRETEGAGPAWPSGQRGQDG
jgi:hypothetical protein